MQDVPLFSAMYIVSNNFVKRKIPRTTRMEIVCDEEEEGYRLLLLGICFESSWVTKCTDGGGILTKGEI